MSPPAFSGGTMRRRTIALVNQDVLLFVFELVPAGLGIGLRGGSFSGGLIFIFFSISASYFFASSGVAGDGHTALRIRYHIFVGDVSLSGTEPSPSIILAVFSH